MRIEERQQPGHRERMPDPVEVAVGSDATRHRKRREQLFGAGYSRQLAFEGVVDMSTESLEEPVRQSAPEPGLDLGGQGDAVSAKTEHHRLVHCDRKVGGDQTIAENPAEDDLAVDQHTIAIKDDESRQRLSLGRAVSEWAGACGVYGLAS